VPSNNDGKAKGLSAESPFLLFAGSPVHILNRFKSGTIGTSGTTGTTESLVLWKEGLGLRRKISL
jgi:hypothetical protein